MKKHGFTLAELLLCVGIIGIVGAMGMMATKHSVEQAYRGYWYTGYVALADSIADFEDNGRFESNNNNEQITNGTEFASHLHDIIGGNINNNVVTAPNNIIYNSSVIFDNFGKASGYRIIMTVPQAKTRNNPDGQRPTNFYYSLESKVLIPYPVNGAENLQNRVDLLPFYLEDGTKFNNSNVIKNRQYITFHSAYCHAINDTVTDGSNTVISCTGITKDANPSSIKVANPRKIK